MFEDNLFLLERRTNPNLLTAFRGSMKQRYAQKLVHKSEVRIKLNLTIEIVGKQI